jgi:uncharacterized protein with von Willebrand factor type A (vWA) domain
VNEAAPAGGRIADNIVHFARVLRKAGIPLGPAAVVDAVRAVEITGIHRRDDFYWTLHSIFATRRDQHATFDEAFRLFWRSRKHLQHMLANSPDKEEEREPEAPRAAATRVAEAMFEAGLAGIARRDQPDIDARLTSSGEEVLRRRDFAQMNAAEIVAAEAALERMRLPADTVPTRRSVAARPPGAVDLRRTMRASLRTGGGMIALRHRRPAEVHPPVVVIADISGSMAPYTRVLLHFFHAIGHSRRVHTFLFGTRLTNVTRELRRRDPDEALAACSAAVADWSGGTRIATALHEFNRKWSRRVLGQGAIVLLFTDGLEREAGDDLGPELDRLHRSCRRLVWLNPLLRFEGFTARARGIRAMLPHVDDFLSIHSLESVADLCRALSGREPAGDPRRWLKAA